MPVPVMIEVVLEVMTVVRVDVLVPGVKVIVVVNPLVVLEVAEIASLVDVLLEVLVRDEDSDDWDEVIPLVCLGVPIETR